MLKNSLIPNNNDKQQIIKPKPKSKKKELSAFTYEEYTKNDISLTIYTIPILKRVCKQYKLKVSGKKGELIERINIYFTTIRNATMIQKYVRGMLVQLVMKMYEKSKCDINSCVNDTDFYTFEPLIEIEREQFYSYTDDKNFTYGFNILSLIELLRKTKKIYNPYTRSTFSKNQKEDIINIYNLTICTNYKMRAEHKPYERVNKLNNIRVRYNQLINRLTTTIEHTNIIQNSTFNNYNPSISDYNPYTGNDHMERYGNIVETRQKTIIERINLLFIEIDQLGNYTQSSWFTELSHLQYTQLYRTLFDIWHYRGQLSHNIKNQICPFHGPFEGIFTNTIRHIDLSITELRTACLIVLENMVYSGINIDIRKIGTLHALTALTLVSRNARFALPWLYESVIY
tara:strand:- start:850 stop:2049 length:1200 start_codon:yes stop_codon:yes gene_type:complete